MSNIGQASNRESEKLGAVDGPVGRRNCALLIDGKLSGRPCGTFLGQSGHRGSAESPPTPMPRTWAAPSSAARRAFDDRLVPQYRTSSAVCRQLRDAMQQHVEELRELTTSRWARRGCAPPAPLLEGPVGDRLQDTAESYLWKQDLGEASLLGIATRRTSHGRPSVPSAPSPRGTSPHQINLAKLGPALAAVTPF